MKVWLLALALLVSLAPPPATAAPPAASAVAASAFDGHTPPPNPQPYDKWVDVWHVNGWVYEYTYYWEEDPDTGAWYWKLDHIVSYPERRPLPGPTDPGA